MTKEKSMYNIGIELSRLEMKQLMGKGGDCFVGGCLEEYMCCCADGSKHCTSDCFKKCCEGNPNCVDFT